MKEEPDVLVIGRNCIDYIAVVDRFPAEDEKAPLAERRVDGGGQGGTSACCIARLGGRVALAGNIGDDEEGRFCLKRLSDFEVDARHVRIVANGRTPVAYLFVTRATGKRTIIYEPSRLPAIDIHDDLAGLIEKAGAISLDPQTTYLAGPLKKRGGRRGPLVYDCERWIDHIEDMMDAADYFIPSSVFFESRPRAFTAGDLHGNIFRLQQMAKGQVVVTHGAEGAYYPHNGRLHHVPAPAVPVKDTTGAGDNFHGAFALAVSRGMDLHAAVKLAVATASLSCGGYGGREALPDRRTAEALAGQLQTRILP